MSDRTDQRTSDTPQRLCIKTRVKVNAWLRVLPKRDDRELHELESLFLSIATGDLLHFETCRSTAAEFHLTCNRPDLLPHNSVQQAWAAFSEAIGPLQGHHTLRITAYLEKRIPEKTGLGAGSGDAGATLLALNQIHEFPFGHDQLIALASSLGSDVPFFVQSGPCIVRGTGENVEPIPALPPLWCCVVLPTFRINTSHAYSVLDEVMDERGSSAVDPAADLTTVVEALRTRTPLQGPDELRLNSFEVTLGHNTASFLSIRSNLLSNGAILAGLSGSGSAVFGIYAERAAAEAAALDVQRRVSTARTIVAEVR